MKVFSLFCGGGGSSLGYKMAGCDVIGGCDIDPVMAEHYKLNLNPQYFYNCGVHELPELPSEFYDLDILDGSPPCSSFSVAGNREKDWGKKKKFREGQTSQVLDELFFDYLDIVEKLRPKVAIAENVKGLSMGSAKDYVNRIFKRFDEIGYRCQIFLVNAKYCGVAQARERVFFIALRKDIKKPFLLLEPCNPIVTAKEAVSGCEKNHGEDLTLTPQHQKYYPFWREGEKLSHCKIRLGEKESSFNVVKLHRHRPAPTLTSNKRNFIHWCEPRYLSFSEWKRLGSFPDNYKALNPKIGIYIVGMSVPPLMMKYVANEVIKHWLQ
jgi:DNA (cytosine-5)-methyltransferase 1